MVLGPLPPILIARFATPGQRRTFIRFDNEAGGMSPAEDAEIAERDRTNLGKSGIGTALPIFEHLRWIRGSTPLRASERDS